MLRLFDFLKLLNRAHASVLSEEAIILLHLALQKSALWIRICLEQRALKIAL